MLTGPFEWWNVASRTAEIWWTRQMGPGAVQAARSQRVEALVDFAANRSPFYRDRWRGIAVGKASLRDLPVVTKRDLMAHFDDWITDRSIDYPTVAQFLRDRSHIGEPLAGKYIVWKSSGSTGEPGVYLQDSDALALYDALLAVQIRSMGFITEYTWIAVAQTGRAALVAATGDHFASIASWQRVCRGMPWPNARAFSVSEPLPTLVAALNEYQPAFLASYPTTLAMLAEERCAGRLRIAPSIVWSGGEYLSHAAHKKIESAFCAVVINEYGASECLSIACSCSHGRLHLNDDWVVLEPVDRNYEPTPPGEPSHTVLLTNLANRIQPIIRYELGDTVTVDTRPCPCGSPLPAIRAEGRRDDVLCLRASDGSAVQVSPLALTTVMEDVTDGHRFQIVQTADDAIDVRLAAQPSGTRSADWHAAQRALCAFLTQQSLPNVGVHLAPRLPQADSRSGKLREVIVDHEAIERSRHNLKTERDRATLTAESIEVAEPRTVSRSPKRPLHHRIE